MFIQSEARKDVEGLSDLIDYFSVLEDGILWLSTGVLVAGWEFCGADMDALPLDECYQIAKRISERLRMGNGWTIQCDLIRDQRSEYTPSENWPDPVSFLIDRERENRHRLTDEYGTRLSRYFLALSYESASGGAAKFARLLFDDTQRLADPDGERELDVFKKIVASLESLLRANVPTVRRLRSYEKRVGDTLAPFDELLEYVRWCVTGEEFPFALPDVPAHLNQYLAPDDYTGGGEPQLGDPMNELIPGKRIAVIAIDGFPALSFAGIMRELDSVPYDFRFCQQGAFLDAHEAKAAHSANKSKWKGKKSSLSSKAAGTPDLSDPVAAGLEVDALQAMSLAEHGKEISVKFSAKVIVMESSRVRLKEAVTAIKRAIEQNCGFSCRIETTNAVAAWLATFPGQQYKDPRMGAYIVTTENLAHMMPLSAPFRGLQYSPSQFLPPKSPPLFYAVTSGGSTYRFHPFVGDVGHQLIVGPTGAGKTTWLALAIAQWFRYAKAQVYAFDKKRTLYTLTKAMGGDFIELSPDARETQLCPLADLSSNLKLDRKAQWLELLLEMNGLAVTSDIRNDIKDSLVRFSRSPAGRSLTDFYMAVSSREVKDALQFYLGGILDGEEDRLELSRMVVFEMDELYRLDKKTMNGALFCIADKIRDRLSSDVPTLVSVDEIREALEHPMAAKLFENFLVEGRKINCSVWMAIQELTKLFASPLKTAVLEQCYTKVCLPNSQALYEGRATYEALGCNALDCERIGNAQPKAEYYVMSPDGRRLINLELGELALSFVAASSDVDRARVDNMIARNPSGWVATWLRSRGLEAWADYYQSLNAAKEMAQYA